MKIEIQNKQLVIGIILLTCANFLLAVFHGLAIFANSQISCATNTMYLFKLIGYEDPKECAMCYQACKVSVLQNELTNLTVDISQPINERFNIG